MGNLVFLLVALGVIALGTLVLALRAREPKGFDSGIKAHQKHMNALSTETRRDSTGIDRIQPVRRVDPLTERRAEEDAPEASSEQAGNQAGDQAVDQAGDQAGDKPGSGTEG
jgi:hypothetical protein